MDRYGDTLERKSRLCGSLDALRDLIGGTHSMNTISVNLVYIVELIANEAHSLHDEECRFRGCNDD